MNISEIYKNGVDNQTISKSLINKLMAKYLKDYKLFPYFNGVKYDETIKSPGCYNLNTRELFLNLPVIISDAEIDKQLHNFQSSVNIPFVSTELLYYYVLFVVYHELTHVNQNKKMHHITLSDPIFDTLVMSFSIGDDKSYTDYHDLYPHEHNANACGCASAISFINKYSKYLKINVDENMATWLLKDYVVDDCKIYSPIEQLVYNDDLQPLFQKLDACQTTDITRLAFGLPISKETYSLVTDIKEGKEKILSIQGYNYNK